MSIDPIKLKRLESRLNKALNRIFDEWAEQTTAAYARQALAARYRERAAGLEGYDPADWGDEDEEAKTTLREPGPRAVAK